MCLKYLENKIKDIKFIFVLWLKKTCRTFFRISVTLSLLKIHVFLYVLFYFLSKLLVRAHVIDCKLVCWVILLNNQISMKTNLFYWFLVKLKNLSRQIHLKLQGTPENLSLFSSTFTLGAPSSQTPEHLCVSSETI